MNKNTKKKKILIRWFLARLICITHLIVSIVFLFETNPTRHLFFIPLIGTGFIVLEIIIFSFSKFRFQYSFVLLFTYSTFIISTIWLLELFRINHLITIANQQKSIQVFSVVYYAPIQSNEKFFLFNKYLWSQIQIQAYVFIIVILKGLFETKHHKLDIVIQTWTTALDVLDFIDLLSYPKLYNHKRFVYATLSIWSISCFQFVIETCTIKKIFIKLKYHRLASIITYSLMSMIITDIPYIIIRLYSIFGVKNHTYTSYFLLCKNIMIIMLQTADIRINLKKTTKNKRIANVAAVQNRQSHLEYV